MTALTPYAEFTYFILLLFISIPAVILGFLEKKRTLYTALATVCVIIYTFAPSLQELCALFLYVAFQWELLNIFLYLRKQKKSQEICWLAVILSIAPLIVVKLTPLAVKIFSRPLTNIGFLGISYLTFKSVQVLVETYDGLIKEMSFFNYVNFLVFFPTISSGPIDRSRRFIADFTRIIPRNEYKTYLYQGINKIFQGFLYKFIIAHLIDTYWLKAVSRQSMTFLHTWNYMYAYSFYLFFDFAGYSLFAIGFSYIFGIKTPENFNLPFISRNIKDFWNRWHITLSYWFRDYIYMRVVITLTKRKLFTYKYAPSFIGYFLLFGLMGLWHGLYWHYIIYGLYHAVLMTGYDLYTNWNKRHQLIKNNIWVTMGSMLITFHIVCFGFLIFSGKLFN